VSSYSFHSHFLAAPWVKNRRTAICSSTCMIRRGRCPDRPVSTAPALAFAFNSGGGYATAGVLPFGVQVDATTPVPLPAAVWLPGTERYSNH
jgi:hypothetical protein